MNLLSLEDVSKQFSERLLLDTVSLSINTGERIGLIGVNGSGKTTLLRMIAGLEAPDSGHVKVWGGVRVEMVQQEPHLDDDATVLEQLFRSSSPQMRLLRDYESASQRLEHEPANQALQQRLLELSEEMGRTDGWAAAASAKSILTRLGISDFDARVETLSGGQRKRVALARALIDRADLLVLDEPTNHIDIETIEWLEAYLTTAPGALLMVTHDRHFLDRVVSRIVELDRRQLVSYTGNYSRYLELRQLRHETPRPPGTPAPEAPQARARMDSPDTHGPRHQAESPPAARRRTPAHPIRLRHRSSRNGPRYPPPRQVRSHGQRPDQILRRLGRCKPGRFCA